MRGLHFSRKQLAIPYGLFLTCFVALPLLVIIYYAFTNGEGHFSMGNLTGFFTSPNTIGTLCYSFAIAIVTTVVCLLLAYPVAYILSQSGWKQKNVIVVMFVLPMWINFTLRITALKEILTLLEGNLAYFPFLNSIIGMTYDFLPFMILPMYTTFCRSRCESGADLFKGDAAAVCAGYYQWCSHGIFTVHDELCRTRYALQQHIYHGQSDRKLFQCI